MLPTNAATHKNKDCKGDFSMKNNKLFIAGMAVALTFTLALTNCDTGAGGDSTHEHQWRPTVWDANVVWGDWITDTAVTSVARGSGHRDGTKNGTQTCALDGTVKPVTELVREDVVIPTGKVLNGNGTFSDKGEEGEKEKPGEGGTGTLPTISGKNVDTMGRIVAMGGGNSAIHNSYDDDKAYNVVKTSLPDAGGPLCQQFSNQARYCVHSLRVQRHRIQVWQPNLPCYRMRRQI
jgi:hypothetical protein